MTTYRQSFLDESLYYKPSQKQITNLLIDIQGKPHQIKNYRELLLLKEEFEKSNSILTGGFQKIQEIIQPKINRSTLIGNNLPNDNNYDVGGMCSVCFEQITAKGINCSICKKSVCRNCIARNRNMKNGSLYKFCEKCDLNYLEATIDKDFLKQFVLYQKAFETLVRQQQTVEVLLSTEKQKIKGEDISQQRKKIIRNDEIIQKLKHDKETNKQKMQQLKNKIDWGETITKSLRVKHRKLKKLLKQSFGSSNSDAPYIQWEPPKAEDDLQLDSDNINQSFITTNFDKTIVQEQTDGANDRQICRCIIF